MSCYNPFVNSQSRVMAPCARCGDMHGPCIHCQTISGESEPLVRLGQGDYMRTITPGDIEISLAERIRLWLVATFGWFHAWADAENNRTYVRFGVRQPAAPAQGLEYVGRFLTPAGARAVAVHAVWWDRAVMRDPSIRGALLDELDRIARREATA